MNILYVTKTSPRYIKNDTCTVQYLAHCKDESEFLFVVSGDEYRETARKGESLGKLAYKRALAA